MILVPVLAVLLACLHTVLALHALWMDTDNTSMTHGYLVAGVSVVLLWLQREARAAAPARASSLASVLLAAGAVLWLFAVQAGIQLLEMLLLPGLLLLAVWAAQGFARARHAAFALGYLYFAIPIWSSGNEILQWGTIYANRILLQIVGIPVFFAGNAVQIPSGVFHIEDGCSGLHFFMVALAIAALLGELRRDAFGGRIKLLVVAAVLAVLTNWIRVFTIILAGHFTHMQHYLVRVSHYGYGWVLFAVAMVIFFWWERRLPLLPASDAGKASPAAAPVRSAGAALRAALPALLILAFLALWHALAARPATLDVSPPAVPDAWQREALGAWQPKIDGADATQGVRYVRGEEAVDLYLAAYGHQEQGKEFSGYNNDLLGGLRPAAGQGPLLGATDAEGQHYLIGASYHVGSLRIHGAFNAQARYAVTSMLHFQSPPTQLRVWRAACRPDCAAAATLLQTFQNFESSTGSTP